MEISAKHVLLLCILILSFAMLTSAQGQFVKPHGIPDLCTHCVKNGCTPLGCNRCHLCSDE